MLVLLRTLCGCTKLHEPWMPTDVPTENIWIGIDKKDGRGYREFLRQEQRNGRWEYMEIPK